MKDIDDSKQFSIVSPLPGSTPPPDMNENNDLKRIEAFLKANNVISGKIINDIPMPQSQNESSRCRGTSSGILSSVEYDKCTTQKQLNTFIQLSKVGTTIDQSQIEGLQTSVSILIGKLESLTKFTFNNFDQ